MMKADTDDHESELQQQQQQFQQHNMFEGRDVSFPDYYLLNNNSSSDVEDLENVINDEFVPLLKEFKEVEACIRCCAKDNHNVNQAFYLCQRAVSHPIAPLYDYKDSSLKPLAVAALNRIFYLCDRDQDGFLSDDEFMQLQQKCFHKSMDVNELEDVKQTLNASIPGSAVARGISNEGFLALNKFYAEMGRHETIWGILRAFHYTDSLSIDEKILHPKIDVPPNSSVELSPKGYKFLVDLFVLFDKDNDGGLSDDELYKLFFPTPGIPKSWQETNFPRSVVCNEVGYVTLQGWLAQWAMTTYLDHRTTLEYLGYFGYVDKLNSKNGSSAISGLHVTRARKTRKRNGKLFRAPVMDRTVFNCFIVGASGCGKTSLLESFLGRRYSEHYSPTIQPNVVVNSVELPGGKQCYLILEELGELEGAILENQAKLETCDVLCLAYDSSDPESFQRLIDLMNNYPGIHDLPVVFVALKADLDRQQQRSDQQPEPFTKQMYLQPPMHISSGWGPSLSELLCHLVNSACNPRVCTPGLEPEPEEAESFVNPFTIGYGALGFMVIVSMWYLRGYAIGHRAS
ncbi:unnamed protein product [Ambrosiozyma monospora]|uniref:Unnamed protein product n=1 Tax=Ambrosiozyma monospora TaxID=43982 RepID=A0ACB5T7J2_AMBMO|nr:unnamed protein product [Ambrosiozyma monospora]